MYIYYQLSECDWRRYFGRCAVTPVTSVAILYYILLADIVATVFLCQHPTMWLHSIPFLVKKTPPWHKELRSWSPWVLWFPCSRATAGPLDFVVLLVSRHFLKEIWEAGLLGSCGSPGPSPLSQKDLRSWYPWFSRFPWSFAPFIKRS